MKEIHYNKLVRDNIPEIIKNSGKCCETEILSNKEYLIMLERKLDEELAEYKKDKSMEELADLLEVIYAIIKAKHYSIEQVEDIRVKKAQKNGAEGGSRTHMPARAPDFESSASAISPLRHGIEYNILQKIKKSSRKT